MHRRQAFFTFLVGALLVGSSSLADESLPTFFFPHDSDYILLEYAVVGSATPDSRTPYLRIYGDGRVRVHRHNLLRRAGDYESYLSHEQLDRLLVALAKDGFFDFDPSAVGAEIRALLDTERTSELSTGRADLILTDQTTTTIRVRLHGYVPAGGGEPRGRVRKTAYWKGLKLETERYPEVRPLQGLQRSAQRLKRLAERVESHPVE